MTNQDPIADREAKIAAWREKVRVNTAVRGAAYTWDSDADNAWMLSSAAVQEAVDLMRSAPTIGGPWGSMPEPNSCHVAEIDRLRAENERLRSVLAAVDTSLYEALAENERLKADLAAAVKAHQFAEASQKVEQGLAKSAEARVAHLERDLAAARADQAAMARLELDRLLFRYDHGDLGFGPTEPQDLLTDIRQRLAALPAQQPEPKPEVCGATMRIVTGGTCANTKPCPTHDTEPAVQWMAAGPNPYAKTDVDLQAFAVRVLPSTDDEGRVLFVEAIGPVDAHGLPDSVILRITCDMGPGEARYYTMVQPDAATRDGDEVLREWLDPDTEGRPISGWVAVMARVLDEVCRRELARGGK